MTSTHGRARRFIPLGLVVVACFGALLASLPPARAEASSVQETRAPSEPIVIAHRGASGYLPEHTLAAYALAYAQGADYIEPDVVLTRDGVAICAHDVTMDRVTDVASVFPGRARDDGRYYWIDFTLEEVRRLRVTTGVGGGAVPTLQEMAALVQRLNATLRKHGGADVGIMPEAKRPQFHRDEGRPIEPVLIRTLARSGYAGPATPCVIQCFDLESLRRMRYEQGTGLRLVWLVGEPPSAAQLGDAAEFCHGLGPSRRLVEGDDGAETELLRRARERGLAIYCWTFKDEPEAMARFFREHRVDGLFTDFPDAGRRAADGSP
ncbi:MAG: glycerophosphodiester phosphodiesterase family protein [Planctomycetota bacterium]